jgi:hypothetical protein
MKLKANRNSALMRRLCILFFLSIALSAVVSCATICDGVPQSYCQLRGAGIKAHEQYLKSLPLAERPHFYLYMLRQTRPRNLGLVDALVRDSAVVRITVSLIEAENHEDKIDDLILALASAQQMGTLVDVDRAKVIALKAALIAKISNATTKLSVEQSYKIIERN